MKRRKPPGPCSQRCGRDTKYIAADLCGCCYSSMRLWKNARTAKQREERQANLRLYLRRMDNVATVRIGTAARAAPLPQQRATVTPIVTTHRRKAR